MSTDQTPERNDREGENDQPNDELVQGLLNYLVSQSPEDPSRGPELVIRMEVRDRSDDPRTAELIRLLTTLLSAAPEGDQPEISLSPGLISPDDVETDVTAAIQSSVGPELDRQNRQVDEARAAGSARAKSPAERYEIRKEFREAVKSTSIFVSTMAAYLLDRVCQGCKWWEDELPEPLRKLLQFTAGGSALGSAVSQPAIAAVAVVAVVAIVIISKPARRRHQMPTNKEDEPEAKDKV